MKYPGFYTQFSRKPELIDEKPIHDYNCSMVTDNWHLIIDNPEILKIFDLISISRILEKRSKLKICNFSGLINDN